ncbi:SBBP repeat-containing protein [Myxococcaceae bacterium GXIMD 01537]
MSVSRSVRTTLLASALALLSAPGCQGDEVPAESAPTDDAASIQALTCEVNHVPVMTSNTSPGGIVTRSGVISASYEAWQAFDGTNSMWISEVGQTPAWLAYEWTDGPRTITRYALSYNNGSILTRAPKNWTFEGWNGSAWVVLDTRTGQTGWAGHERREYAVASPGAYKKYRLSFTDDNDTRTGVEVISLGKVELLSCEPLAWTRTLGVSGGLALNMNVAVHSLGYGFTVGMAQGAVGGAASGGMDLFLAGYDMNGALLWSQQTGSAGQMAPGYAIALSPSEQSLYATGWTTASLHGATQMGSDDVFLEKYSIAGAWQWTRQLGVAGMRTRGQGVAVDGSENVYVSGQTDGALDGVPAPGYENAFLIKYNASGTKQWTRLVGLANKATYGTRSATDTSGNVYMTGTTNGGLDGNVLAGTEDLFVTKFNSAGVKQWTRQLGKAGQGTMGVAVGTDSAGSVYVTGNSACTIDGVSTAPGPCAFLAKYDASGVKQWVRAFGAGYSIASMSLAVSAQGVHVGGFVLADLTLPPPATHSFSDGRPFVARYNAAGTQLALRQMPTATLAGATRHSDAPGLGVDAAGTLYLAGRTLGDLDGIPLKGSQDGYLRRVVVP